MAILEKIQPEQIQKRMITAGMLADNILNGIMPSMTGKANYALGANAAETGAELKEIFGATGISISHTAGRITITATGGVAPAAHAITHIAGGIDPIPLASAKIFVGNVSGYMQAQSLSGDATLSNAGVLTLANTAVTPGTYGNASNVGSFTVDAKGRLTAASSIALVTTNIAEGTNLYYTDARTRAALSGTANQINYNSTTGNFSTPQNIHTAAAPTFAGLTLTGTLTITGVGTHSVAVGGNGLTVFRDGGGAALYLESYGVTAGGSELIVSRSGGSVATPSDVANADVIGSLSAFGRINAADRRMGRIQFFADGTISPTSYPASMKVLLVPNGSITETTRLILSEDGTLTLGSTKASGTGNLHFGARARGGVGTSITTTTGFIFDAGVSTSYDLLTVGNNNGVMLTTSGSGLTKMTSTSAGVETTPLILSNFSAVDGTATSLQFSSINGYGTVTAKISNVRVGSNDYRTDFYNYRFSSTLVMSLYRNAVLINTTIDDGINKLQVNGGIASGAITASGDVAVNGGDLTSTATTFNLLNATVTTANMFGAATSVTFGALTGTATFQNAANIFSGVITVSGTGTSTFASQNIYPNAGYFTNLGSLSKKYLTLHAAELWVETLVAQNTQATIGGRVLVGTTTQLIADLTAVAVTMDVKYSLGTSGTAIARLEANGQVEFISVNLASWVAIAGGYRYSITRNLDGTGADAWSAGDAVFSTGGVGSGFIDLYSVNNMKSASISGPSIVGNIRNSLTYNDWSEAWAIGNLNGLYGYVADTYGAGFGKYANSSSFITIDPTNGIRFTYRNGSGVNSYPISLTMAGNATFSGTINASAGVIGGWSIGTYAISSTYGLYSINIFSDSSFTAGLSISNSSVERLWLGIDNFSDVYGIIIKNTSAALVFSAGTTNFFAGWTFNTTQIYNGTNIILDSGTKAISINSATYGAAGIQLQYNAGSPRAYIGNGTTNYFQYDGTNISWAGVNTSLTAAGVFTASNATITGTVTASSGTIGGWTLATNRVYNGSTYLANGYDNPAGDVSWFGAGTTAGTYGVVAGLFTRKNSVEGGFIQGGSLKYPTCFVRDAVGHYRIVIGDMNINWESSGNTYDSIGLKMFDSSGTFIFGNISNTLYKLSGWFVNASMLYVGNQLVGSYYRHVALDASNSALRFGYSLSSNDASFTNAATLSWAGSTTGLQIDSNYVTFANLNHAAVNGHADVTYTGAGYSYAFEVHGKGAGTYSILAEYGMEVGSTGNIKSVNTYANSVTTARALLIDSAGLFGTTLSSARYKSMVRDLDIDSALLYKLRPVSFQYQKFPGKEQFGLIAEEVNHYLPCLVEYDTQGRPDYVGYERLPVLLLSEAQKHEKKIEELKRKVAELERRLEEAGIN